MRVSVVRDSGLTHIAGPADLHLTAPGSTVVLEGEPIPGDHARWGGALSAVALRGGEIRWNPNTRGEEE